MLALVGQMIKDLWHANLISGAKVNASLGQTEAQVVNLRPFASWFVEALTENLANIVILVNIVIVDLLA